MSNSLFRPWIVIGGTCAVLALTVAWLLWPGFSKKSAEPLVLHCAAGIKAPVEEIVREFQKLTGVPVHVQYGGSQTILAGIEVSRRGDLYLPADETYLELGRRKNLVAETIPLARMQVVIAVRKGNPQAIRSLDDLLRPEIKLAQGDPEATAIGHVSREALRAIGQWENIQRRAVVIKLTVNDVLNDLQIGAVDAGFAWDALVQQYPGLDMVRIPALTNASANIGVGVLACSTQPTAALRLARFIGAPQYGLQAFARQHYQTLPGDDWAESPELVLYSGAVNRVAIEESIEQFEKREGVRINCIYNGCGILVGQIKAVGAPDVYLTCDASFVTPVADLFQNPPMPMSSTEIVILVPKANPRRIQSLADLGKSGLRIGLANPEQSTLGTLTKRLLEQLGIYDQVIRNVVTQTPTADLLVNQLKAGSLDAVVVYVANTTQVRDQFELVRIPIKEATAVQTFSVGQNSKHKRLAERFLQTLRSAESRGRYEQAGFEFVK